MMCLPRTAGCQLIVPLRQKAREETGQQPAATWPSIQPTNVLPLAPLSWAERLERVYLTGITQCLACVGYLRVTADVTDPAVIEKILIHVGG